MNKPQALSSVRSLGSFEGDLKSGSDKLRESLDRFEKSLNSSLDRFEGKLSGLADVVGSLDRGIMSTSLSPSPHGRSRTYHATESTHSVSGTRFDRKNQF